jgi:feruloyl esterase
MAFVRTIALSAVLALLPSTFATVAVRAAGAATCESLATLVLPQATITSAQTVPAGAFQAPTNSRGGGRAFASVPSFCRVAATLAPTSDSDIKIEVWLPMSGWNGKFQAVGNGGWAGMISYPALAQAVIGGYAGASTDAGHVGNTAAFAVGHPEKVVDMGFRAVHEMTVKAKLIIDAYYGSAPKTSFWNGCSQGGRQGITEAQRYPADFDAIVAGAPAVNWMLLNGVRMAINLKAHTTPDSYIPPEKYAMVHRAALEACDASDGVTDRVIDDPTHCKFDPQVLECRAGQNENCLTRAQVETARAMYAPLKNPKSGTVIFPALLTPGSESGWGTLAGPEPVGTALDGFKYVVNNDANWDWRKFDAATDIDRGVALDKGVLNSADANLKPFFDRGGKLLMYHGWSDPQVPALNSVDYFDAVLKAVGRQMASRSIQLYMVPGMLHCSGGPGTDSFDKMAAIEQWMRDGSAPAQIVASHFTDGLVDRTRPLCPYGQVARYKGTGSTDDAANFQCAAASAR